MILISSSTFDISTNYVIDWLLYFDNNCGEKIIRINDDKDYEISFDGKTIYILKDDVYINLDTIKSYWYRRGRIRFKVNQNGFFKNLKEEEEKVLEEYIHHKLRKIKSINDFFNSEPNKIIVLEEAQKVGLLVPESFICQNKRSVNNILIDDLVTKTILGSSMINFNDKISLIYTKTVNKNKVLNNFLPSLFQQKVDKKYELRILYFENKFWSMAIFSQLDSKTIIHSKNYNYEKPTRKVPFQLPKKIENKLKKLLLNLKYNCCSIDMIVTLKNEFVFLEINPIGQFGMISIPCNYKIEKIIANFLMNEN